MSANESKAALPSLRKYREANGLTYYELAKRVGVGQGYVKRIESGNIPNPGIKIVIALADALEVTVNDLLKDTSGDQVETQKQISSDMEKILHSTFNKLNYLLKKGGKD